MGKARRRDEGFRQAASLVALAFGQAKYEAASSLAAVALLVFAAAAVYIGLYDDLARFAGGYALVAVAAAFLLFSLCHFGLAYALTPPIDRGLREFSAASGLGPARALAVQRSWYIMRNWHVVVLDALVFLPAIAHRAHEGLFIGLFAAYALAAWPLLGALCFSLSRASAFEVERRSTRADLARRRIGERLASAGRALAESRGIAVCVLFTLAIEYAGASDLLRHRGGGGAEDGRRWAYLFLLCLAVAAQGSLAAGARAPKRYYRLFPVSFGRYLFRAYGPSCLALVLSLAPAAACMTALHPALLALALPYLAATLLAPIAIAERGAASGAAAGLWLFFGCVLAALLWLFVPAAGVAAALAAAALSLVAGRRAYLFAEVLE